MEPSQRRHSSRVSCQEPSAFASICNRQRSPKHQCHFKQCETRTGRSLNCDSSLAESCQEIIASSLDTSAAKWSVCSLHENAAARCDICIYGSPIREEDLRSPGQHEHLQRFCRCGSHLTIQDTPGFLGFSSCALFFHLDSVRLRQHPARLSSSALSEKQAGLIGLYTIAHALCEGLQLVHFVILQTAPNSAKRSESTPRSSSTSGASSAACRMTSWNLDAA